MLTMTLMVGTALLTSLCTWGVAYWYWSNVLQAKLEQQMKTQLDDVGEQLQARVKQGVMEAGEEIAPMLRAEVTKGVKDGVSQLASAEVLQNVAKSGAGALEEGLDRLLGKRSSGRS